MLESVILLSEAENINNNSSYLDTMTLETRDTKDKNHSGRNDIDDDDNDNDIYEDVEGPTPKTTLPQTQTMQPSAQTGTNQHFAKNPQLATRNTHHIKAKSGGPEPEKENTPSKSQNSGRTVSPQNSTPYESFTLAKKEGRPIYVARASYR